MFGSSCCASKRSNVGCAGDVMDMIGVDSV